MALSLSETRALARHVEYLEGLLEDRPCRPARIKTQEEPLELIDPFRIDPEAAGVVYGLVSVDEPGSVRYVGATTGHPVLRMHQHSGRSTRNNAALAEWVDGVGDKLRFAVLEVVRTLESIPRAEHDWYQSLKREGHDLLNILAPSPNLPFTHGTAAMYSNHGCRCPACTEANREDVRKKVASRKANRDENGVSLTEGITHGLSSTYANHSCRCVPCSEAHSVALRAQQLLGHVCRLCSVRYHDNTSAHRKVCSALNRSLVARTT